MNSRDLALRVLEMASECELDAARRRIQLLLAAEIAGAVAEEREACAHTADVYAGRLRGEEIPRARWAIKELAEMIRSRG